MNRAAAMDCGLHRGSLRRMFVRAIRKYSWLYLMCNIFTETVVNIQDGFWSSVGQYVFNARS